MFCDLWLIFCSFFCQFHCKCNTICKCNSSSIIFLRRSSFTTFGRTKISAYPEITASECNVHGQMGMVWKCVHARCRACQTVCWFVVWQCKISELLKFQALTKIYNLDKFWLLTLDLKLSSCQILSETTQI